MKKKKKQKKQRTKNKEITKKQKKSFSVISQFFLLISLFWTTWPKKRAPKNTIKIGVSATHFVENSSESRNSHFWTKEPNPEIPVIIFFFAFFFLLQQQKTQQLVETPIFIVFWQT